MGQLRFRRLYNGRGKTFFFVDYQGTRIGQDSSKRFKRCLRRLKASSGFTNFTDLIALQSGIKTDALGRVFPVGTIFRPIDDTRDDSRCNRCDDRIEGEQHRVCARSVLCGHGWRSNELYGCRAGSAVWNQLPATRLNANAIALLKCSSLRPLRAAYREQLHVVSRR